MKLLEKKKELVEERPPPENQKSKGWHEPIIALGLLVFTLSLWSGKGWVVILPAMCAYALIVTLCLCFLKWRKKR